MSKEHLDALYCSGNDENWTPGKEEKRTDWEIVYSWLNEKPSGYHILDVGCFGGEFLRGIDNSSKKFGVEIHQQAASRARKLGVDIIGNDFDSLDSLKQQFHIVTSFDVIEHSFDPKSFLKALANVTTRDGEIIITTGNSHAASWKLMGSRYWYCTIGEHLSFINPEWCEYVAHECGLQVAEVQYFSHAQRARLSIANKIKETMINLVYRFTPFLLRFARKLGLGGKTITAQFPELLDSPPIWSTARDHFIVRFKKLS
ncbi:class I SAM-dependent methyltransferase [Mariprofundus micogutta]|uniref:class I SAM-dependent methyltransferase n=1 Tax=Mariprofundus micogutta TaxID=1921010 RepID=UPI0009325539|nr:methyltransferase domain-containing protein [Mariprofundus micogutta]